MKYLLTGGSGSLGTELQKHLDCWAPSRAEYDISWKYSEVPHMLKQAGIDLWNCKGIIHAAAWTDVPGAETNKKAAVINNIVGTENVANLAHEVHNIPVYYISSDYVYPGLTGNYRETDKTDPFNFYGFTKLAGEAFMESDKDLIIRTSFKPSDLWEKKYNKAFIDLYTSADYVDVVARDIAFVIEKEARGIINVGTERKSIYDLALSRFPDVGEMSRWDVSSWIKMPSDISMNIEKLKKLKEDQNE